MSTTAPDNRITTYNPVVPTMEFEAQFPVFDNDDLSVYLDGVERTDFVVSSTYVEGVSTNAKVVFSFGLIGKVDVVGARDPRRANRFGLGPIPTRDLNLAFDTIQGEMQEARRDISRALLAPFGETLPDAGEIIEAAQLAVVSAAAAQAAATSVNIKNVENRAEIKALDTSVTTLAFLRESGREGLFKWTVGNFTVRVASDTAEGIYIKSNSVLAADGAWVRVYSGTLSVKWFGAVGDGVADETAAFKAIAALSDGALSIKVPSGSYLLSEQVVFSDKNVSLSGSGIGVTKLIWVNSAASRGLRFVDNTGVSANSRSAVKVSDLSLTTRKVGGGAAISANYSIADDNPFGETPTFILQNLDIRGDDFYATGMGTHWWDQGVNLTDTGAVSIENVHVRGVPGCSTDAFRLAAVESPNIRFFFNSCTAVYIGNGLRIVNGSSFARIEGVYLSQVEFVACVHGIYVEGGPSHAVQFENGHIDSDGACVEFISSAAGSAAFKLVGSYISLGNKWGGSYVSTYAVVLPSAVEATITGNRIEGDPGKSVVQNGVLLNGGSGNTVANNSFRSLTTAIGLSGSVADSHGSDNIFLSITNFLVGTGTNCSFNRSVSGGADLFGGQKYRSGSTVVTLDANGNGSIPISPAFPATFGTAVISNGEPDLSGSAAFSVRQGTCTLSSIAVAVRPNPGAVSVRVNWIANGT